ncbi:unnamed protein product [Mytilus coruscus]|uniref:Uncharacterized protein n=1 Tax=Mytilus coruscus TaxID=42192 RepID=A0A6J8AY76_MYTCO|nr:unnamed protein product [Mytilus coruscus]
MIDVVGRDEGSKSDFFVKKVVAMKRVKGEKKKKRNVLSRVISGKTVTEDDVLERVKEHVSKNPGKKASDSSVNKSCAKSSKKGQNGSVGKSDSQKPGTSGVGKCVSEWAIDSESESESEIREDEKCCVCKKFVPEQENHLFEDINKGANSDDFNNIDIVSSSLQRQIIDGTDVNITALLIPHYECLQSHADIIEDNLIGKPDFRLNRTLTIPEFIKAFGKCKRIRLKAYPECRAEVDANEEDIIDISKFYRSKYYEYHKCFPPMRQHY